MKMKQSTREKVKFSIIIPAHNEEKYIGKCLDSILEAAKRCEGKVEIIVVLNRCTDKTEKIAKSYNCITIKNNDKNLSKIRNAGAKIARGEILVTIDADTRMTPKMLDKADKYLSSGRYIGGGVSGTFDRRSLGITVSFLSLAIPVYLKYGTKSVGIFWCYRKDFEAINGFNEKIFMGEDIDFALRLEKLGEKRNKRYGTIHFGMITSSRKFDRYGDWYLMENPKLREAYLKGTDSALAKEYYYDYKN
ncbi:MULTISPECIES: glycosyltransferase [Bacillus]|nr:MULTISPECIES: glycosyltransferase [Bacillus]MBP1083244.1 glycosyltransferase involved in cell wall biosynthesis [Bacillus capparidis]MED1097682.1 glycosyltransferase [Bacillus capparidis]